MSFPIASFLGAAACFLLIASPGHAQPSADTRRFPRVADLTDLSFEPSSPAPAASQGRPFGLQKGYHPQPARFPNPQVATKPGLTEWPRSLHPAGSAAGFSVPPAPAPPRQPGPAVLPKPKRRAPVPPGGR